MVISTADWIFFVICRGNSQLRLPRSGPMLLCVTICPLINVQKQKIPTVKGWKKNTQSNVTKSSISIKQLPAVSNCAWKNSTIYKYKYSGVSLSRNCIGPSKKFEIAHVEIARLHCVVVEKRSRNNTIIIKMMISVWSNMKRLNNAIKKIKLLSKEN